MVITKRKLYEKLQEEKLRRQLLPKMLDSCFDKQLEFINDKSRRKALFVPRRSGKSYCVGIYMVKEAIENPACKIIYIGLSKQSAENVMWKQVIMDLLEKNNIKYTYNINTKTVSFDNGSTIKLVGADASYKDMHKLLGGKYRMAIIDECQNYTIDLEELVTKTLSPAVADYIKDGGGVICMCGTAGNHMGNHYWYRMTKDGAREPGWTVYSWSPLDNPHMKDNVLDDWYRLEQAYGPNYRLRVDFRQEWLCEWVIDNTEKVYRFEADKNILLERMPEGEKRNPSPARAFQLKDELQIAKELKSIDNKWRFLLGMDLGYEDSTAWVIGAFNRHNKNFYIVESFKQNHLVIDQIAQITQELHQKYNFVSMAADTGGLGKLIVESIRQKYRLNIKAANKEGEKAAIVARMNSDFLTENIKVIEASNKELIKEWNELIIDHKAKVDGKFKEDGSCQNHLADAALYCFREARHFWGQPEKEVPTDDLAALLLERKKKVSYMPSKDFFDLMDEQQEVREIVRRFRDGKDE